MWKCVKCNEQLEDTFNVCWCCGTSKDGVEDPEFTREEGWDQPVAVDVREADAKPTSALPPPLVVSTCPKCGENRFVGRLDVMDRDGEWGTKSLTALLHRKPQNMVLRQTLQIAIEASICGSCGYTELYAKDPAAVWDGYELADRRYRANS